jgi:hypothetical protein
MNQVEQIKLMTPSLRGEMYTNLKQAILDGAMDPLEFMVKKKAIEETLELVAKDKDVKDLILAEIAKYKAEGRATKLGAALSVTTRPTYDYAQDASWAAIKAEMAPYEQRLKAQEERVKTATKNGAALITEDGEVLATPVPVQATESVTVKMPK